MNLPQLMITGLGFCLLMTPLLLLAFVAGRRSHPAKTLRQFDRPASDHLSVTGVWTAEFDGEEPDTLKPVPFHVEQVGCRVVATGHSSDGTSHFLEGVLIERRFCGILIDEKKDRTIVATLTAELLPEEGTMNGMRSYWSPQAQALVVRKVSFARIG